MKSLIHIKDGIHFKKGRHCTHTVGAVIVESLSYDSTYLYVLLVSMLLSVDIH